MADRTTGVEVVEWDGQSPLPPLAGPGKARIVFDTASGVLMASLNATAYQSFSLPLVVATPNGDHNVVPNTVVKFQTLAAPATATLPATPGAGQICYIKAAPNSTSFPVTIAGNGNDIDGSASFPLDADRMSVILIFDGTEWGIW